MPRNEEVLIFSIKCIVQARRAICISEKCEEKTTLDENRVQRENPYKVWILPLRVGFSPRKAVFESFVVVSFCDKYFCTIKKKSKLDLIYVKSPELGFFLEPSFEAQS